MNTVFQYSHLDKILSCLLDECAKALSCVKTAFCDIARPHGIGR